MFMQFHQDFNVVMLIYRLATGYPLCHHSTVDIKENMALNFKQLARAFLVLEMMMSFTALIVTCFPDHS
jgi:hypothetical protein